MIALRDCMQDDFDKSQLANEPEVVLADLQAKAQTALKGWEQLQRPLEPRETVWYHQLLSLIDFIDSLTLTVYGCND